MGGGYQREYIIRYNRETRVPKRRNKRGGGELGKSKTRM